ncbi:TonB-dependent receptor [Flagellimonas myxillae]|uniref:TonB-dependent receptor n=1 Tax=Flagellimonas myxillae TaxID=2942214 RepID=UPI00201F0D09|nr:TonB-dependent receptor plug domain-containing protein [Muricauda myxillae]MCL6264876.1 TonB-dependent receptor plug domain-containing protein [Muricauda myxillae]
MVAPIRILLLAIGMVCFSHLGYGSFNTQIHVSDSVQKSKIYKEKIYLHLDRSDYRAGESIWFKAYVLHAETHKPIALNEVVYVDLISPENEVLFTKMLQVEEGVAAGSMQIPLETTNGVYTIRAFTNYMRNFGNSGFYRKKIKIGSGEKLVSERVFEGEKPKLDVKDAVFSPKRPDLQFFPEGGNLVDGFINRVGFKSVAPDGLGADTEGRIIDGSGKLITEFQSSHLGMGMFSFIPQAGEKYQAQIHYNGDVFNYDLPKPMVSGTIMHVFDRGNHYQVEIKSSRLDGVNGYTLTTFQRGIEISSTIIEGKDEIAVVNVPKNVVTDGIVQFTLSNGAEQPICERLFFHLSGVDPIEMEITKSTYGKKELVELEIELGYWAEQLESNMSLSVTEVSSASSNFSDVDIKTYLLLTSELKGEIENPAYYFNADDEARRKNLDLLMMTQGWRGFMDQDVEELQFSHETGITLKGKVFDANSREKPVAAQVSLAYRNRYETGHDIVETDANGEFEFTDLKFNDSTSVFVYASTIPKKSKRNKKDRGSDPDFYIELDSLDGPEIQITKSLPVRGLQRESFSAFPVVLPESKPFNVDEADLIRLKETVVSEKKLGKDANMERKRSGALYVRPSFTLDYEQFRKAPIGNALTALQGRIPGVQVVGETVYIRNRYDRVPLYLLDGFPVEELTIMTIPITDIDFVDYIRPEQGTIYGIRGGNGIIAVYTLDGRERFYEEKTPHENGVGSLSYVHPGLGSGRKFYKPVYNQKKTNPNKPDFRRTLHWEPNVELDGEGKAKVSFHTSDIPATYQATLQGISDEGEPIHSKVTFQSE